MVTSKNISIFMKLTYNIPEVINHNQVAASSQINLKLPEQALPFIFSDKIQFKTQWQKLLVYSHVSDLGIIFFKYDQLRGDVLEDNIKFVPPFSLPGKLLVFLLERFKYFKGASNKGLVILSIGHTAQDAATIEAIILELAHLNNLEPTFLDWIENSNFFCNKKVLQDGILLKTARINS